MQTQYSTYRTLLAPVSGHGLSEAEAKDILRQILPHLSELHDRQQAHGSISLDTIAYDYNRMEIILLAANGTNYPIYLAPEVIQTQQATPTADIYALGLVIIVLLTGFPPQALKTSEDTWNWQELCNISDQFRRVLDAALFAEPAFRYSNAGQMLQSLQPIINPSEPTITSLANNHGNLLLPTLLKDLSSKQSSQPVPLSSKSYSLETVNLESNYSHKTKKLKVNFSNSQIHRKAKAAKNISKAATHKVLIRTLLTMLLGFGISASGAVGAYFYMQSKSADTAKKNLEFANAESQLMDKESVHTNVVSLLGSATMLQTIPLGSRIRAKADQILTQWAEDTKKNNDLIQKVENASKDEKWQAADKYQAVLSPLPNVEPPHNPTPETYNPPKETYNPTPAIYNPPVETSNLPLPPAPRVAK